MNNHLDRLLASAQNLRLTEGERSDAREMIQARMRFPHACRMLDAAAAGYTLSPHEKTCARVHLIAAIHRPQLRSIVRFPFLFSVRRLVAVFCVALLVLGTGGGALAYAAENALPGDRLYQMKVAVNEPAVALLHRSPEAKARWAEKKLERRLLEAEKLAMRDSVVSEIEETVTRSIGNAEKEAEQRVLVISERQRREEFRRRLQSKRQRRENIIVRFREKRMEMEKQRSPRLERQKQQNLFPMNTHRGKARVSISSSVSVQELSESSIPSSESYGDTPESRKLQNDTHPFRIELKEEKHLPRFRETIRPSENVSSSESVSSKDASQGFRKEKKPVPAEKILRLKGP